MQGNQRQFAPGEVIIREGDSADCAYMIESGRVRVSRASQLGDVVLAELSSGELVGEMGIISEKPRSATVTAIEDTRVQVIGRADLLDTLQQDRSTAIKLLRVLFDRLRQADARLSQLEQTQTHTPQSFTVKLVALTPQAREAMGCETRFVEKLPCTFGREDNDPLSFNDVELKDRQPFQISRSHLMLMVEDGKLVLYDRGSKLGTWVRGQLIGGPSSFEGPVLVNDEAVEVVLGSAESPMRFEVSAIRN